jgi:hypothetical protein
MTRNKYLVQTLVLLTAGACLAPSVILVASHAGVTPDTPTPVPSPSAPPLPRPVEEVPLALCPVTGAIPKNRQWERRYSYYTLYCRDQKAADVFDKDPERWLQIGLIRQQIWTAQNEAAFLDRKLRTEEDVTHKAPLARDRGALAEQIAAAQKELAARLKDGKKPGTTRAIPAAGIPVKPTPAPPVKKGKP